MPKIKLQARHNYDVVILGGGPAGCATALALHQIGITNVLLVEASQYETSRIGESLPPNIRVLLDRLNLWEDFLVEKHAVCLGSCSSWGSYELGYNDFLYNPYGNGWHLDRRRFDRFLARKTADNAVDLALNARFMAIQQSKDDFLLKINQEDNTSIIKTRFVVDAMGRTSRFAKLQGSQQRIFDRLIYIAAFFDLPPDHHMSQLTMLEAVEYGWWYCAKLPDNCATVAVASDPELVKQLNLTHPVTWQSYLTDTLHIAEAIEGASFRADTLQPYAISSFFLDPMSGKNWLAVGDAASSYDPLASQGIYKALLEGIEVSQAIAKSLDGDRNSLQAYQQMCKKRFDDYITNLNYLYSLEKRWSTALFWQRRKHR